MKVSSTSLRRLWSASSFSSEAFGRLTLGTTRSARNCNTISRAEDSTTPANSVLDVGRLYNPAEPITVGSIPKWYKNEPPRHAAMGTVVNLRPPISTFASDPSSTWSDRNDSSSMTGFTPQWDELSFVSHFWKNRKPACVKKPSFGQSYSTVAGANYNSDSSEDLLNVKGFDICLPGSKRWAAVPNLATGYCGAMSFKYGNHKLEASKRELRPGMVLLKNHLPHEQQVEIVKTCQTLGVGPGGFYQPAYKDGTKLDLQMMCLGLNWDPERLTYEFIRSVDGCEVPAIPYHFRCRVREAFSFARTLLRKQDDDSTDYEDVLEDDDDTMYEEEDDDGDEDIIPYSATYDQEYVEDTAYEDILPSCVPNVCIVNFYPAASGRLGLHQDCSESRSRLSERISVVSFSVGDSAEFLYGDERDANKAEKVILESGDVLIFGGESRNIYHGESLKGLGILVS